MRVVWFTFSDMTSEPWLMSLEALDHEIDYVRYDRGERPCDRFIVNIAHQQKPDLIIYSGMAGGDVIPGISALQRLRAIAPTVLLTGDLCDPPWWPYLEAYRQAECFDTIVNIDGNPDWPQGGNMKIVWLAPSDMLLEPVIQGLRGLDHDSSILHFDKLDAPVDRSVLNTVDALRPELVLWTGQNGGPYQLGTATLERLKEKAPTVLLCHDGTDATWTQLLETYRTRGIFSAVVNIDGNVEWPSRATDLTLLTPVDPRFYPDPPPLKDRPVDFGFQGGYASPSRAAIIEHLVDKAGLVIGRRDERYGTYKDYAQFLMSTKIVPNVPISGSDNARQVKGRVVEAGWARCCLLEHVDSPTRFWFEPERDYYTYRTKEEAAELVSYILDHPAQAQRFADRLHAKVKALHGPDQFWPKVFAAAGVA